LIGVQFWPKKHKQEQLKLPYKKKHDYSMSMESSQRPSVRNEENSIYIEAESHMSDPHMEPKLNH